MPKLPRYLKELDQMLADLLLESEAMLLSQLDGFLAGILVCPELIMPGEWLPKVWGHEEVMPAFENADEAQKLIDLIMQHYNTLISDLQHRQYQPLFDIDTRNDDILWEMWIEGFDQAVKIRPDTWQSIYEDRDEDAEVAIGTLLTLAEIAEREQSIKLEAEVVDQLTASAPDLIANCVDKLHASRISKQSPLPGSSEQPAYGKVGRNAPCPCGSGKKYKKCCSLN